MDKVSIQMHKLVKIMILITLLLDKNVVMQPVQNFATN